MPQMTAMPFSTRCGRREFRWGSRTFIMGILNVTPDSFSGDGLLGNPQGIVEQARRFAAQGADILDVGGESTRPGSTPVAAEEETARILPALRLLAAEPDLPPISVDTYKSEVARAAVEAGASIINDIWGLRRDPAIAEVAAAHSVPLVLMHNQKGTAYGNLMADIIEGLRWSIDTAMSHGVPRDRIIIDPGFGFGKTPEQNLEVLRRLDELAVLGQPILAGTSRKSMIGRVLDAPVNDRLEGTAATVAIAIARGADIVRVHDVKEMARVARMSDAILRGWQGPT